MASLKKKFPVDVMTGLDTKLRNLKTQIGVELVERVQRRTPVHTGALQASWGFQLTAKDIRVFNLMDYAPYIEYGTPHIAPRAMLRTTLLEMPAIVAVARTKVGLK